MEEQAIQYSIKSLDHWGSFGIVVVILGGIIWWLLRFIDQQRKTYVEVIAQKDAELEKEREYSRRVSDQFRESAIQTVSTLQATTGAVERLQQAVEESRRIVQGCTGRGNGI